MSSNLSINTNVPSMTAQRILQLNSIDVNNQLQRIATGYRINRGADDPAGLIASENLRAEMKAAEAEARAAERNEALANTADAAVAEVGDMLAQANGMAVAAANTGALSGGEREALQGMFDQAVQSIERIIGTASFNGQRLFSGNITIPAGNDSFTIPEMTIGTVGMTNVDEPDGMGGTAPVGRRLLDATSGGAIPLGTAGSQAVIGAAIDQFSTLRGSIGAFTRNAIIPQRNNSLVRLENTAAANSVIRDTDFGKATSALARASVLQASNIATLATANSEPSRAIGLLG